DVYNVTYVDGKAESATLVSQNLIKPAINQVIAIGKSAPASVHPNRVNKQKQQQNKQTKSQVAQQVSPTPVAKPAPQSEQKPAKTENQEQQKPQQSPQTSTQKQQQTQQTQQTQQDTTQSKVQEQNNQNQAQQGNSTQQKPAQDATAQATQNQQQAPAPAPNPPAPAPAPNPDSLVHATPEQAKLFAQGAAAQMGWTGKEWEDLVWLWNRESGWRWNAENPSSHAYGIPQALPGNKMKSAGANWHEDAAVQISWGLTYIKSNYKSPSGAVKHSRTIGWY
ncbi:hypothetical protein HMPREF3208_00173, partial [Gardnerella vaginalis]